MIKTKANIISIFLVLLGTALPFIGLSQAISNIRLVGLQKTQESYIWSLLQQKIGDEYKEISARSDHQVLQNIPLFHEVEWKAEYMDDGVVILYNFIEKKSILPTLNFGGFGKNSQAWAEAGFIDFNAFGSHALFKFVLAYYGKPSFEVYLDRPRWFNEHWGLSVLANQRNSIEPIYLSNGLQQDYDVSKLKFDIGTSYFASNFLRLNAGLAFLKEDFIALDTDFQSDLLPNVLREQKLMFRIGTDWDRMKYFFELQEGWQADWSGEALYPLGNSVGSSFYKSEFSIRHFRNVSSTSFLAFRLKAGISTNNESPIAAFVKDNYVNIRGIGDRVERGWSEMTLNMEWRKRLIYRKQYFLQGVIFTDLNGLSVPGESFDTFLNDNRLDIYGGLGVRVGLNEYYASTLRIDLSFDLKEQKWAAVVIGVGQFF